MREAVTLSISVGLSVCRSVGLSVCRSVGLSVCRSPLAVLCELFWQPDAFPLWAFRTQPVSA
jgi:hypothetical protein